MTSAALLGRAALVLAVLLSAPISRAEAPSCDLVLPDVPPSVPNARATVDRYATQRPGLSLNGLDCDGTGDGIASG